ARAPARPAARGPRRAEPPRGGGRLRHAERLTGRPGPRPPPPPTDPGPPPGARNHHERTPMRIRTALSVPVTTAAVALMLSACVAGEASTTGAPAAGATAESAEESGTASGTEWSA